MWASDNRPGGAQSLREGNHARRTSHLSPQKCQYYVKKKLAGEIDAVVFLGRDKIEWNSGMLRLLEFSGGHLRGEKPVLGMGSFLSHGWVLSCTRSG